MERTLVIRRRSAPRRAQHGQYELLEAVGQGGMGEVWLARREGAPDVCVLKRLNANVAEGTNVERRFHREAHLAAFLEHPNVARTLDAGVADGAFYIAMEHIAGVDLAQILRVVRDRGERVPIGVVVTLLLRVLDALDYVHDAVGPDGAKLSIVHRDLAPKNVMVAFDGRVKLIDFGVARASLGDFETQSNILIGTVQYFSPEQARGERVDRRSDLYTVAAVAFELLTGRTLIADVPMAQAIADILTGPVPDVVSCREDVPPLLADVVEKGLQKVPRDRFETAGDMAKALRAVNAEPLDESELARWIATRFPDGAASVPVASVDTSYEQPTNAELPLIPVPPPAPSRAPTRVFLLVGALVVAVVGLTIAVRASRKPPPPPPAPPPPPIVSTTALPTATARPVDEPPLVAPPKPPAPPPPTRVVSTEPPAATAPSMKARVVAALEKRGLVLADLVHQHDVAPARAYRRAMVGKDEKALEVAGESLLLALDQLEFRTGLLRTRLLEAQSKLRAAGDATADDEILDLLAQLEGDRKVSPAEYRRLCVKIDRLLSRASG